MAENQINPLFNVHEKYKEVIIINPYRFSDPDAVAQAARIMADGGTVIDFAFMNLVISTMKSMGIYGNVKLLANADFGVKINPSTGALSKEYDISGNNNDSVQATGASQPIWSLSGGKGVITYDGVNDYMQIGSTNAFKTLTAGTIIMKIKSTAPTIFFGIGKSDGPSTGLLFWVNKSPNGKITIRQRNTTDDSLLFESTNNISDANPNTICYSVSPSGNLLYNNGTLIPVTYTTGSATTSMFFNSIPANQNYYFGGTYSSQSVNRYPSGQDSMAAIFNIALSQSQITQLTNLGL